MRERAQKFANQYKETIISVHSLSGSVSNRADVWISTLRILWLIDTARVTASNADLSAWPLRGGRRMMALWGYLKSHHTEEKVHLLESELFLGHCLASCSPRHYQETSRKPLPRMGPIILDECITPSKEGAASLYNY